MSRPRPDRFTFLIRLAPEITTKARRARKRFQHRLVHNLRDALENLSPEATIDARWNRIFVEADAPEVGHRLARVFGISSVSPVEAEIDADLDRIVEAGRELFHHRVMGRRYAVDCHRSGRHAFSSRDVKFALGAALNPGAEVDLDNPDVRVEVEIRDHEAWLFAERLPGPGGLPLGVQGTAVCLMSGGFDSPVAAWLMLKRGVQLEFVFCNLAGAAYERSVLTITRRLQDEWGHGQWPRLHVVDFDEVVSQIQETVTPRYWQVVLKRQMYRAASAVAREVRAEAIVTGESLGQVSSQTLGNLRAIHDAADFPVFRPLIGFDKMEIIDRAHAIGTGALSARVQEYCAILPTRPVTHSRPEAAQDEESRLDSEAVTRATDARRVLDLRDLDPKEFVEPYIFADEVPEGAQVLDCRPRPHWRAWHYPGAEQHDPSSLLRNLGELPKEGSYVLYCDLGVQTAQIAEIMQRVGYEAYSFRGGTRALKRYAQSQSQDPAEASRG